MTDYKSVSTPMSWTMKLSAQGGAHYRSIVGALQYVTLTRPDVAYAVNHACQYMHAPTNNQWSLVKRIMRYLKGTQHHWLVLRRSSDFSLQAFSDADWARNNDHRKSTDGYAIFLDPNLISWASKKQCTVARSSTDAEYKALAVACAELTWLRSLFA
ncbi:uncharacterized mitochondrial protein AtMg00810-like [Telopea speciosissima]|uniref:uncharacterized mitochondrial protein AtMg00810-like n=1 Tax=Telopea speciosissima TaxID=54955 RepID=UPI001CC7CD99|nr:uncharacterized mitochondrial protein AtMg00810-like [Telopea speciosissima]